MNIDITNWEDTKLELSHNLLPLQVQCLKELTAIPPEEWDVNAILDTIQGIDALTEFTKEPELPTTQAFNDIEEFTREWLIPDWLPANTVTQFSGDGGAGKTWMILQVACHVLCNFQQHDYKDPLAFLDPHTTINADRVNPNTVIYATWEDEPGSLKWRINKMSEKMKSINAIVNSNTINHFHIVDMRRCGSIWGPGVGKHVSVIARSLPAGNTLRQICEDLNAKLLIIDPLSGAFGGNENDRTAVYDFVGDWRGWADDTGCAILTIGHLPKSKDAKDQGYSGSTAWEASSRSMWNITQSQAKIDEDNKETMPYWELKHSKSNYSKLQPPQPLNKEDGGWWTRASSKEEAADSLASYKSSFNKPRKKDNNNDDEPPITF